VRRRLHLDTQIRFKRNKPRHTNTKAFQELLPPQSIIALVVTWYWKGGVICDGQNGSRQLQNAAKASWRKVVMRASIFVWSSQPQDVFFVAGGLDVKPSSLPFVMSRVTILKKSLRVFHAFTRKCQLTCQKNRLNGTRFRAFGSISRYNDMNTLYKICQRATHFPAKNSLAMASVARPRQAPS